MADDTEQLVVLLEARINDFEKNMAKASKTAGTNFGAIERRSKQATDRLEANMAQAGNASVRLNTVLGGIGREAFGGVSRGALLALAPVLSVTAALAGAKAALQEFGDIADNSKAAGLGAEFFQGIAYQAQLGGVEIDALAGALALFNTNSGLAVVNKGKMLAALKALDPELLKNIQAATTQEQRVRLAADAIAKAGTASEKSAISSALFGDAGKKLADVFSGGAKAIDATAEKARALGLIVSGDLIANADRLGDEFDTASKVMDLQFKQVLIDLAPLLISTAQLAGDLAFGIHSLVDAFKGLEEKSTSTLEGRLSTIKALLATNAGVTSSIDADGHITAGNPMRVAIPTDQIDSLKTEQAAIEAVLKTRQQLVAFTPPDTSGGSGSGAGAAAAIREGKAIKDLIADLEAEQSLVGATESQQRVANALREAGATATEAQKAKIEELIVAIDAQRTSLAANKEAMTFVADGLSNAFGDFLTGAKSANDAVRDLIGSLAKAAIQAALMGQGPFAGTAGGSGIIGTLFGLKAATGGHIRGAGTGTSDSIPALVSDGEFIINAGATAKHLALLKAINAGTIGRFASGGPVSAAPSFRPANDTLVGANDNSRLTINAPITIHGSAGTESQNADLAAKMQKGLEETVRGLVSDEIVRSQRPGNVANSRGSGR